MKVDESGVTEYKWKRRIPASKFGDIIKMEGVKAKDKHFTDQILGYHGEGQNTNWVLLLFCLACFPLLYNLGQFWLL